MSLAGWGTKKYSITISAADVATDEVDFPVLVNIGAASGKTALDTTAIFTELGANSLKIAVEDGDTGSQCYVEVENWDSTNKSAQLWVKIPALSSTVDTVINLYYDSTQADNTAYVGATTSTPAQNVWDANFVAVYHMTQDPSGVSPQILDSTANAHHQTVTGSMTSSDLATGLIGPAITFDGVDDKAYTATADFSAFQTAFTISILAKFIADSPGYNFLFAIGDGASGSIQEGGWHNSDYLYIGTAYNDAAVHDLTVDWGVYHTFTWILDHGSIHVYRDATKSADSNAVTIKDLSAAILYIGANSANLANATIDTMMFSSVVRSDNWIAMTDLSCRDQLCTWALAGAKIIARTIIDQVYDLEAAMVRAAMSQVYSITFDLQALLVQVYGIKMLGILRQPYGDAHAIMARLVQWYGDAATARRVLDQLYGDALMLRTSLAQEWSYPALLTRALAQRYGISGHALRRVAVQQWAIKGIEMVRAGLDQPWLIMDGSGRMDRVETMVTVGGVEVSFTHINIEASRDQYCLSCEIHLASQADYVRCLVMDELVVRAAGLDFVFFLESRQRRRGHPTAEYTIHGLSRTALLDAPYAEPVPLDAVFTGMASEIAAGLAPGYTIDWRTVDWHIPADTLMPGDQTPLAVIRQIAAAVGAVIQTEPDGTMVVEPAYPVPVPDWPTATVGHTLSDALDFFSTGETFDHRPGHNRFLVGDQMASQDTLRLEAEDESAFARIIRAYQTPWADDFDLRHTGGDWVALEPEGIEERVIEDEIVEIVSGTGNTRYPIYERLAMEWLRQDLGTVTVSEDGTVRAAIEGESLLRISYRTRCRRYRMTDQRTEQVQVVAETTEG